MTATQNTKSSLQISELAARLMSEFQDASEGLVIAHEHGSIQELSVARRALGVARDALFAYIGRLEAAQPEAPAAQPERAVRIEVAAREVLTCIQAAHRPPVRDVPEFGRMVSVRLHALADLQDALAAPSADAAAPATLPTWLNPPDDFAEHLQDIGWRSSSDAQRVGSSVLPIRGCLHRADGEWPVGCSAPTAQPEAPAVPVPRLTDAEILEIWIKSDTPSKENDCITGPIPFACAIEAAVRKKCGVKS